MTWFWESQVLSKSVERPTWPGIEASYQQPHEWAWRWILQPQMSFQRWHPWPTIWPSERPWARTRLRSHSQVPYSQYTDEIISACCKLLSFKVTWFAAIDNWYSGPLLRFRQSALPLSWHLPHCVVITCLPVGLFLRLWAWWRVCLNFFVPSSSDTCLTHSRWSKNWVGWITCICI